METQQLKGHSFEIMRHIAPTFEEGLMEVSIEVPISLLVSRTVSTGRLTGR